MKAKRRIKRRTTSRPRGRARSGIKVVTPEMLHEIERMHLRGVANLKIAERFAVGETTIRAWLTKKIKPAWKRIMEDRFEHEARAVAYLEEVAWERFQASCEPTTTEQLRHELTEGAKGKPALERLVERAVKTVTTSGAPAFLDVVIWCREWFARVGGYYVKEPAASTRIEVMPVVLVKIASREDAKRTITFQEMTERAVRDQNN